MSCLGLDIGGANLKAANGLGWARTAPFALWRNPQDLAGAIDLLIHSAPPAAVLAVTMTGELCDCFRTKADGVRQILAAVEQVADRRETRVYLLDGRLVSLEEAQELPQLAAASNWHALANFACRFVEGGAAVLIDIGSTTADIVPLAAGRPATSAVDDTGRLLAGELVYTGVGRTPVCAVTRTLPWRGQSCPVAAELFATTADVYVTLGELHESASATWTADGRPLTKEFARERLARMVCADATTFGSDDAQLAAEWVRMTQVAELQCALARVVSHMAEEPGKCVLSGSGEFLARHVAASLAGAIQVSLGAVLGPETSSAAAAHAVATLAVECS